MLSDITNVSPAPSVTLDVLTLTLFGADFTVTLQVIVLPLEAFDVMLAVPTFFAVILLELTVATPVFELLHLRLLARVYVSPTPRVTLVLLSCCDAETDDAFALISVAFTAVKELVAIIIAEITAVNNFFFISRPPICFSYF